MTAPPFELRGGHVRLDGTEVVKGVDFRLEAGEFVVLLGPNGSGKTTLVRALLGLAPLARGELRLFGEPEARFRGWERIGFVPQRFTAGTGVPATVSEVVLSGRIARARRFRGWTREDREAARGALEDVGLAALAGRPVAALSGGQQQRVLIARALAGQPDALVLDEPLSGVDVESQEGFARTLAALHGRGRSVLLVAHALGAMEPLAARAVVLQGGIVAYDGPPLPHQVHIEHEHHHADRDAGERLDGAAGSPR